MLPSGGSSSQETSECQYSPLTRLEFASAWMGRISGCPSGPAEPLMGFYVERLIAEKQHLVLRESLIPRFDFT